MERNLIFVAFLVTMPLLLFFVNESLNEWLTLQANAVGEYLQSTGCEIGVTTGRKRRCGWLDIPLLKWTDTLNNYTALALTKLDILDGLDEIKIGVAYKKNGTVMDHFPSSEQVHYMLSKPLKRHLYSSAFF